MRSSKRLLLALVSFFTLAVFFGLYASSASNVFALRYICGDPIGYQVKCCAVIDGKKWCTICDNTPPPSSPSNCGPRFPGRSDDLQPPTNLAPPKVCPDGSSPDANGVCPPVTQGTPPSPPPKGATGTIEQPPTNLAPPPPSSQTTTCPDSSSPDANGQCPPPTTTGNQNPQSPSSLTGENKPSKHKLPKAGDTLETPGITPPPS
jgi:hypothetical protein